MKWLYFLCETFKLTSEFAYPAREPSLLFAQFLNLLLDQSSLLSLLQDRLQFTVSIAHARINQNIAKHYENRRRISLHRFKQLRENAIVI